LRNLPFDLWRRNAVWPELVLMACDLLCWAQALPLDGELAVAEPKALRYRLLQVAARVVRHARRLVVRLQRTWPWAVELARAFARLRACRCAADHRPTKLPEDRPALARPTASATATWPPQATNRHARLATRPLRGSRRTAAGLRHAPDQRHERLLKNRG
jgi:hypothetical protein